MNILFQAGCNKPSPNVNIFTPCFFPEDPKTSTRHPLNLVDEVLILLHLLVENDANVKTGEDIERRVAEPCLF